MRKIHIWREANTSTKTEQKKSCIIMLPSAYLAGTIYGVAWKHVSYAHMKFTEHCRQNTFILQIWNKKFQIIYIRRMCPSLYFWTKNLNCLLLEQPMSFYLEPWLSLWTIQGNKFDWKLILPR